MSHTLPLTLLGVTALLGMTLAAGVLREVGNPAWLRRAHLLAGGSALLALLRAVRDAAAATPPLPGSNGHLPAVLVACAFLLGLTVWLSARYAQQGLTIVRALHVCVGFCAVILAAAWILRPGA